jgi:hypothetical protein
LVLASEPFQLRFSLVVLPSLFLLPLIPSHELITYKSPGNEPDRTADQGASRSVTCGTPYDGSCSRS